MIRVFVIGTALLYAQALIGCIDPENGNSPGAKLLSVSTEFDSVSFHNAARHTTHVKTAALDDEDCSLPEAYRL